MAGGGGDGVDGGGSGEQDMSPLLVKKLREETGRLLARAQALVEAAQKYNHRLTDEAERIASTSTALAEALAEERAELKSKISSLDEATRREVQHNLDMAQAGVNNRVVKACLPPRPNGLYLRMFLGNANVVEPRVARRHGLKDDYNAYKDQSAVIFLAFPIALLYWMRNHSECINSIPVILYQCFLLYFYTALALRENVLAANGSNIRPWWIIHHYCAMAMALTTLTWQIDGPDCAEKQVFVARFLSWALLQGIVMLLQNRYQRKRTYTRIALGKASTMDVVGGESSSVSTELWLLYPLLFALQGFQFYNATLLLESVFRQKFMWQLFVCGVLFMVMAIGNTYSTAATLVRKIGKGRYSSIDGDSVSRHEIMS
eukprot:jgi/Chlat1/7361/Chrsp59S06978